MNLACAATGRVWGRLVGGVWMVHHQLRFSAPAHAQLPVRIGGSPCRSLLEHRCARTANSRHISSQSLS